MSNKETKWIGVDLDGTLAHYDTWRGIEHIGEPIKPMVDRIKEWLSNGIRIKIFTARVDGGNGTVPEARNVELVRKYITEWCLKHIGIELEITNIKDYGMIQLWDDRAVQVEVNTGNPVGNMTKPLASNEDLLEQLYWEFDNLRKVGSTDERTIFKGKLRFYANEINKGK